MEDQSVSRKPSKLIARTNTLHRSPHSHSGSGAGLWLANSTTPSPDVSTYAEASTSQTEGPSEPQHNRAASPSQQRKKVYHFSAELARASFGGRPLTLGGGSADYDPIYINKMPAASSDDGDVDLDLSFDYISRFDRSLSSSDQQDSSGAAFDSSQEHDLIPPPTSHFSPDDTPESLQAPGSDAADAPTTPIKLVVPEASSSSGSPLFQTSPSPNSKAIRSMRANADWDKRRKAPPAPLDLTPGSEAKRQRQLASNQVRPLPEAESAALTLLSIGSTKPETKPSQELVGKSLFSPITPATASVPLPGEIASSPRASDQPLPMTPLSATRRGAAINRLPHHSGNNLTSPTPSHGESSRSPAVRRAASTSTARAMEKQQSSEALRRTPTAATRSPSCSSSATPVQSKRARSHSNRSFRASASLASLGPPPFPPPNEPLPSPALSPSFQQDHSVPSTSAYHTASDANSTASKAGRTRPSASSIDFSEAPRSLRSRTTQTGRSSLDSFRTANSDGMAIAHSNHSIHDNRRWASEDGAQPPPLPPLERYEALFPSHTEWGAPQPSTSRSNNSLGVSGVNTSSTLTSVPMAFSNTVGSTATTAMTWSMSDRSTPSTHHSPLTPFTPAFSDTMPGTSANGKTQFAAAAGAPASAELPVSSEKQSRTALPSGMTSLSGAAATLREASTVEEDVRGNRNTEQWILTQRQRKALLQHEELASHQRLLEADQDAVRLSIRADERTSRTNLPHVEQDTEVEARSRQDSRSTVTTDDEHAGAKVRQTMVISTASTPDESVDPFNFVTGQPSLMPPAGTSMERAASHDALRSSSTNTATPMTRNRSGTVGPWPQSPLLLDVNVPAQAKSQVQRSAVSPALTTIIHSNYSTPQLDASVDAEESGDSQRAPAVAGLGLDLDYPSANVISNPLPDHPAPGTVKGFAPITTDLLRQATRFGASPHLSIQMSPEAGTLRRVRSKSKEVLLTRESRQNLNQGLGFDLVGGQGPSPLLPNDCRSPRTASGKETGSGGPGGLASLVKGSMQTDVTVHRAQVANDRPLLPSQSIASSISAFAYNATPAHLSSGPEAAHNLGVPTEPKTGSIGWRRNARRSREPSPAQALALGMRADKRRVNDSADVKFVNINLDDGGLETEVMLPHDEASRSSDAAKAGQWVSKLWSSVTSPRRTSFNIGAAQGDRSEDIELANNSTANQGNESKSSDRAPAPAPKDERSVSRGSFRPLSLVQKRQSSGRYQIDNARQGFRSPTPGEEDEVAEKDARAVALRLLAGSPRIPAPVEEGVVAAAQPNNSMDRADLSAEEREKERIDALKKLRRMSAIERQQKRSSGIGYITSSARALESPRLPYVSDRGNDVRKSHDLDPSARHGGLSREASVNKKRMSMTVFGGKERAQTCDEMPTSAPAVGATERAWLDAMRSPRVAESPSGFTPRMAFEPHDWGAASSSQQHQHVYGANHAAAGPSSANHIPLMLSGSATAHRQALSNAANAIQDHGLTVSELDRARDEMRRLAGQGTAFSDEELAYGGVESFHTPMPDAPDTWTYDADRYEQRHYVEDQSMSVEPTTELNDFGISPEKKEAKLHRRTRTARFADDDYHHHQYEQHADDQPTVSIFTRSQQHRHRTSGSFSAQYNSHNQPPSMEHRSRSKRRASQHAAANGHGLFGTPAALLDGNTPSKNMFWAGFLGMPWLWMIGGWYLTPDGQLRHPSTDDPRVRGKLDVWQHEPSMQNQGSANSSPNIGSNSTTFGGSSYEQAWGMGQGESVSGLGLSGMPSTMSYSYAASSIGTTVSAQTTNSDPNRPPPSKARKSKTRSFGTLLDTNPQVSFYQSPVRVVQEPQPSFGNVWRHPRGMEPLLEAEEPRRSRMFAGHPGDEFDDAYAPSPVVSSSDGTTTAVSAAEPMLQTGPRSNVGYQVTMATKTSVATPWKDLERYVLLNRVAAILSGVLVFAGFTGAVYAVVTNF